MTRASYGISNEEFAVIWNRSKRLADVARETGMPKKIASARASDLRQDGVNLKKFEVKRKPLDIDKLNRKLLRERKKLGLPELPKMRTPPPPPPARPSGNTVSKKFAVQAAINAGVVMPAEIVPWVKSHYGIKMTNQQVSTCKTELRRHPIKEKVAPTTPAAPVAPVASNGVMGPADAKALKKIVDEHGVDSVREWLEVFE